MNEYFATVYDLNPFVVEELHDESLKKNIQNVLCSISKHDLDCVRDYTYKFPSETDKKRFLELYASLQAEQH